MRRDEPTDFTPFGYLRNPGHRVTSWGTTFGGNLRSATDWLGVEWVYPVGRDATTQAGIGLETEVDRRACRTRAEFDAIGLTSRHHSAQILGYDWQLAGVRVAARFFLVDDDTLGLRATVTNTAAHPRPLKLSIVSHIDPAAPVTHTCVGEAALDEWLPAGAERCFDAFLTRTGGSQTPETAPATLPAAGAEAAEKVYARLLSEDRQFALSCPTLSGDWPAHWREGLQLDFETTRLNVQRAGGIFRDVWPSWMAGWPRVVLAEGALDMLRLAYADPALAQRAVLSLFRDAPAPNVPCVFEGGEYNMLAADGSRCGTSPAWCLPFLDLELLYLRTLDRAWLGEVYPLAAAYLDWWLTHRVDPDGWMVYKCTWESGEDGNPRLDPTGSGDADISQRVRPVELQATVAHAANVLALFAFELGLPTRHWQTVEAAFRERTRAMYDPDLGRYRDWLIAEQRPQPETCPETSYWGVDACRYSAQSLTPLLLGEPLPEAEVWRHATAPWTDWPSWTWTLVESAAAAGLCTGVGQLVFETIDRVYRVTTRRELGSLRRPLPGSAPEFWPSDWRTYAGSDAYGWGATTANLLIRHLVGFKESRQTDGWVAELTPALPPALRRPGARYAIRGLTYRGLSLDLSYAVIAGGLEVELDLLGRPRALRVTEVGQPGDAILAQPAASRHRFSVALGYHYALRLD